MSLSWDTTTPSQASNIPWLILSDATWAQGLIDYEMRISLANPISISADATRAPTAYDSLISKP